ncbi:hypothetical protein OSTOST_24896, partial [Ostertagia ostertagi]
MERELITKCQHVASRALRIPISFITVTDTSTDKKYNQQQNGGTQGADVHGRAIMACCEKLMIIVRPILKEEPDWRKAVLKAYKMRVPLQASEHIGWVPKN